MFLSNAKSTTAADSTTYPDATPSAITDVITTSITYIVTTIITVIIGFITLYHNRHHRHHCFHLGPFCMVCKENYVWSSGEECMLCNGELEAYLYSGIGFLGLILAVILMNIVRGKNTAVRTGSVSSWELFISKATTKYKILINFVQILGKVSMLYPFRLPRSFLSFFEVFNIFSLDIQLLPFNCLFETDFHSVLVATTLLPIAFVGCVFVVYALKRFQIQKLLSNKGGFQARKTEIKILQSKCEFTVILVTISVFPIISATIFQTFVYDTRLENGQDYLRADYKIERSDPTHQYYVVYSCLMALLYCVGLPLFALQILNTRKLGIQNLQEAESIAVKSKHRDIQSKRAVASIVAIKKTDPRLVGLSPLYKDFCAEFWWFQILLCFFTTFQTGIITLIPAESTSQVLLALLASIVMLIAFGNAHPYISWSDDILAQSCQFSLVLVQIVGLLQMNEYVAQDDWLYGPILIVCTAFSGGLGVVLILAELLQAMAPEAHQTITGSARRLYRYFKGISLTAAVAPTGLNDNVPSVATPLSSSGLQEEAAVVEEQRAPSVTSARVKAVPNLDGEVSDCPPMRWEFNSDQAHIDACRVFNSRLEL
jgi:hypothetical protein